MYWLSRYAFKHRAVPWGLCIRSQEKLKYCFFLMRANCPKTETKTNDEYPLFSQSKSFAFPSLLHSLSYYWKVDEAILPSNKGKWVPIFCSNYKLYRQSTQMVHMVVTTGSFKGNIKQQIAQHCTSTAGRCATRLRPSNREPFRSSVRDNTMELGTIKGFPHITKA